MLDVFNLKQIELDGVSFNWLSAHAVVENQCLSIA